MKALIKRFMLLLPPLCCCTSFPQQKCARQRWQGEIWVLALPLKVMNSINITEATSYGKNVRLHPLSCPCVVHQGASCQQWLHANNCEHKHWHGHQSSKSQQRIPCHHRNADTCPFAVPSSSRLHRTVLLLNSKSKELNSCTPSAKPHFCTNHRLSPHLPI